MWAPIWKTRRSDRCAGSPIKYCKALWAQHIFLIFPKYLRRDERKNPGYSPAASIIIWRSSRALSIFHARYWILKSRIKVQHGIIGFFGIGEFTSAICMRPQRPSPVFTYFADLASHSALFPRISLIELFKECACGCRVALYPPCERLFAIRTWAINQNGGKVILSHNKYFCSLLHAR